MPRKPFNTTCDIFKGPGTALPGSFVGTFQCRYVVEDGIFAIGPGCPVIPAYLTIQGYQPQGAWTYPYFGVDAALCDRIAIPSGYTPQYYCLYTDIIIWGPQVPYFRAYLVRLPVSPTGPVGGLVFNGSAVVTTVPPFTAAGGLVFNGSAIVTTVPPFTAAGGILLGGDASSSMSRKRFIVGDGGLLFNGSAIWSFTPGVTIYWEDTFTDTNGTAITSHVGETTPGGYTMVFGTAWIQSNFLANDSNSYSLTYDPAHTSYTATVLLQWDVLTTDMNVVFRSQDPFNRWRVNISMTAGSATGFTLRNDQGGGFSGFGTLSMFQGNTYTLILVVTPTTVSATISGVNVSTTDSALGSQTKMGFQCGSSATISNFFHSVLVTA